RLGIVGVLASPLSAYAVMPLADVVQEHRVYIAGLGFALASAWLAQWAYGRFGKRAVAVWGIVTVIFGFMTLDRNRLWADRVAWWETPSRNRLKNHGRTSTLGRSIRKAAG